MASDMTCLHSKQTNFVSCKTSVTFSRISLIILCYPCKGPFTLSESDTFLRSLLQFDVNSKMDFLGPVYTKHHDSVLIEQSSLKMGCKPILERLHYFQ